MKRSKIQNMFLEIFPIILVVFIFLILNKLTPLIADDYCFSMAGKDGSRTSSISDILRWLYNYYMTWSGRSIAHFFALFCLFVGKSFFNIANTIVYCGFILLIQFHGTGSLKKINSMLFLGISIALWFLVPSWGQNFLWLDGSCNYLWTTTVVLLFLVPFRKKNDNASYKMNAWLFILFFFLGVLAGWSNENMSTAVLFLLIAYFSVKIAKKERIAAFEISGMLGFLIGFIFLVTAPGNTHRAIVIGSHLFKQSGLDVGLLCHRIHSVTKKLIYENRITFWLSLLLGSYIVFYKKKKINLFTMLYFLAGLMCVYSMIGSPIFPARACLSGVAFFSITVLSLFGQIEINIDQIIKKRLIFWVTLVGLLVFSYSFVYAWKDIVSVYLKYKNREEYILSQKAKGIMDIFVEGPVCAKNKHTALYEIGDIYADNSHWINKGFSCYYGVNSITAVENSEERT
jgi:hypothetical protein